SGGPPGRPFRFRENVRRSRSSQAWRHFPGMDSRFRGNDRSRESATMAAHAAVAGHDAGRQALDQLRSRAVRAAEAGAAAGWQHEFLDDDATVTQAFVQTPTTPFAVTSARRDPDNGLVGWWASVSPARRTACSTSL